MIVTTKFQATREDISKNNETSNIKIPSNKALHVMFGDHNSHFLSHTRPQFTLSSQTQIQFNYIPKFNFLPNSNKSQKYFRCLHGAIQSVWEYWKWKGNGYSWKWVSFFYNSLPSRYWNTVFCRDNDPQLLKAISDCSIKQHNEGVSICNNLFVGDHFWQVQFQQAW